MWVGEDTICWAERLFGDFSCLVCGQDLEVNENELAAACDRAEFIKLFRPDFPCFAFCFDCAGVLANAYVYRMGGGEILTPGKHGFPLPSPRTEPKRAKISHQRRMKIFERDGYCCQAPGCTSQQDLTIDHIRALANGGTDKDDNLQTMCLPCNMSKGKCEDWRGRKVPA